jgi:NAD(P)H-dependent flavin oxidoreductase YrpB (nitropropane dioxygenase family)
MIDSSTMQPPPWLIQGGMGIAISNWTLARQVSLAGQLGVVSGTGIEAVFIRRLQDDGVDDRLRTVLERFPLPSVVENILQKFDHRRPTSASPYRTSPMSTHRNVQSAQDLLALAAYVEVALAKEGHDGIVGINLLTKVQVPTVPTLFGAMLAGVDYVVMGAGIPVHIPGILDQLANGDIVETSLDMVSDVPSGEAPTLRFDPGRFNPTREVRRPTFLGIVSSHVLASALIKRSDGVVGGLVIEAPIAGGHNAPPRGPLSVDVEGNPIYGDRDRVNFEVLRQLGVPFWIAGGVTTPQRVREAIELGATGVQVGTLFAYCRESGLEPGLKDAVLEAVRSASVIVRTSTTASSTGYPFKVASIEGTLSDDDAYAARTRICDLGYLREAFMKDDGTVGYRCPSEPIEIYVAKGGDVADTNDRVCLCNALMATAGLGQIRSKGERELPIVTTGDCTNELAALLAGRSSYGAADVIAFLQEGRATSGTRASAHFVAPPHTDAKFR